MNWLRTVQCLRTRWAWRIAVSVGDVDCGHRAQLGVFVEDAGSRLPVDVPRLYQQVVPVGLAEQAEEDSGYPGRPTTGWGDGGRLAVAVSVMSEQHFECGQFALATGGDEPSREFVSACWRDLEAGTAGIEVRTRPGQDLAAV
jgi:hypothetical protein